MKLIQDIPWPRIFAEGVAIIISILLAFWIQAWWEGQQERGDERIVLQSLLDDLNQKIVENTASDGIGWNFSRTV